MGENLCRDGAHRWDAQVALAKGGVEDGDLCSCGKRVMGDPSLNATQFQAYPVEDVEAACRQRLPTARPWNAEEAARFIGAAGRAASYAEVCMFLGLTARGGGTDWHCRCPVGTPIRDGWCQVCHRVIAGCD